MPIASCLLTSALSTANTRPLRKPAVPWGCTRPAANLRHLGRAKHELALECAANEIRRPPEPDALVRHDQRNIDRHRESQDLDVFNAKALDIITSTKARDAFDLSRESDKTLARYGHKDDKYIYVGQKADSAWDGHKFLLARRLVEAGVPVVTLRAGGWDHHGNVVSGAGGTIFISLRSALPLLDRSIHALVTDLHDRGLDKEVLVLVWGEFGRTPKISQNGRDHWPDASFALFAGAVKTGQVIGETDSRGQRPKSRPLGAQNVLGTVYHTLGIDWKQKVNDFTGRPTQLLDDGEAIEELVG